MAFRKSNAIWNASSFTSLEKGLVLKRTVDFLIELSPRVVPISVFFVCYIFWVDYTNSVFHKI